MRRIYVESSGLNDWKSRLADPDLQWKRGRSAFELAVCWEKASKISNRGLPSALASLLDQHDALRDALVLFAVPEHKVSLHGRGKASQTDLWALLRNGDGLISLSVEAKAGEPFDKTVDDWLKSARSSQTNRQGRLEGLCQTLQIEISAVGHLRYQLLHRTASALLEAQRCGAAQAIMLVQSFGSDDGFADFSSFASHLGATVQKNTLAPARPVHGLPLWLGWLDCSPATDADVLSVTA